MSPPILTFTTGSGERDCRVVAIKGAALGRRLQVRLPSGPPVRSLAPSHTDVGARVRVEPPPSR